MYKPPSLDDSRKLYDTCHYMIVNGIESERRRLDGHEAAEGADGEGDETKVVNRK